MSETVELLHEELSEIFGPAFGHTVGVPGNLTEDVDAYLSERGKYFGGAAPASKKRGKGQHVPPEKKKGKSKGGRQPSAANVEKRAKAAGEKPEFVAAKKKKEARGKAGLASFFSGFAKKDREAARSVRRKAQKVRDDPKVKAKQKKKEDEGEARLRSFKGKFKDKDDKKINVRAFAHGKKRIDPKDRLAQGSGRPSAEKGEKRGGGGRSGQHNPFKRSPNLGPGPGTPPDAKVSNPRGKRRHLKKSCWDCECSKGSYSGCNCTSLGCKDYPKGTKKVVKIDPNYKEKYNSHYRKWRADQGMGRR